MRNIPGLLPYRLPRSFAGDITNAPLPPTDTKDGDVGDGSGRTVIPPVSERDIAWDFSIGGISFLSGISTDYTYMRDTAQVTKDQFDAADDAGEHTLSGWWLRSQSSWHAGAGQEWLEPAAEIDDKFARIRFDRSFNMDVWTTGKASRLPDVKLLSPFTDTPTAVMVTDDVDNRIAVAHGSTLEGAILNVTDTNFSYTWGGSGAILSGCADGKNYYVANATGIYKGPLDNSANGQKLWALPAGAANVHLAWVKDRLIVTIGPKLYEVIEPGNATTPPTIATVRFTHPAPGWSWYDFASSPIGVLAVGIAGSNSAIYHFTLDTSADPPVMNTGSSVVTMPEGERIHGIASYMDSFVGIATNKGVRVAVMSVTFSILQIDLGPISYSSANTVGGITANGRWFYAAVTDEIEGESGLVRIDLGMPLDQPGRLAWANDLVGNPAVGGISRNPMPTAEGTRMAFTVDGVGLLIQRHAADPVVGRDGWIRTSKVRFNTVEPKWYRYLRPRGSFSTGSFSVYVNGSDFVGEQRVLLRAGLPNPADDITILDTPQEWIQLRFQFSGDLHRDMYLSSYQIKGSPATTRQRIIQLVANCYDSEKDKAGNVSGYEGFASQRLKALEQLESSGAETVLSEWMETVTVRIDKLTFIQDVNPTPNDRIGGIVIIQARTLTT